MTAREFAVDVVRRLQEAGRQALWAGGCVRDALLGHEPDDYDVATDARPEEVVRLFRRTVTVGASFGVIEVIGPGRPGEHHVVQVATFRSDGAYTDGRRPDQVVYSSAREDALRRDFTINGMFFDPVTEQLHDFVGGREDLAARLLRAIGDPQERFTEDKLRLLRGVRIATRFGLAVERATGAAIARLANTVVVVSAERIATELRKLLADPGRGRGVRLLDELRLAEPIFPELAGVWSPVAAVVELLPTDTAFPLALAALLHDIGRSRAEDVCLRLRLSNEERLRVAWLVEHHAALGGAPTLRRSRLKPLLAHAGARDLVALHRALAAAQGATSADADYCEARLAEWSQADLEPTALVTGHDLLGLGLEPGPRFKVLLDAVRAAQLDGEVATTAQAMRFVQEQLRS